MFGPLDGPRGGGIVGSELMPGVLWLPIVEMSWGSNALVPVFGAP